MKHYFIVKTRFNEWGSNIKYIADTFEEAEKFLKDPSGWYGPKGTGKIEEVDSNMNEIKKWDYLKGEVDTIRDSLTGKWIKPPEGYEERICTKQDFLKYLNDYFDDVIKDMSDDEIKKLVDELYDTWEERKDRMTPFDIIFWMLGLC